MPEYAADETEGMDEIQNRLNKPISPTREWQPAVAIHCLILKKQARFRHSRGWEQLCPAIRVVQMAEGRQLPVASEADFVNPKKLLI